MLKYPVVFVPGEPPEFMSSGAIPHANTQIDGTYAYLSLAGQWLRAIDNDNKTASRDLADRIWKFTPDDQVPGEYRATILLLT